MKQTRSAKFWRKNEKDVMKLLGLQPTSNSGSGWVEKGDGQNDNIVCELKSTDANSYRLRLEDLRKVEHHAAVAHKLPVFVVQFLESNELFLVVKPSDIGNIAEYMDLCRTEKYKDDLHKKIKSLVKGDCALDLDEDCTCVDPVNTIIVKSSNSARKAYGVQVEKRFRKKEKQAK